VYAKLHHIWVIDPRPDRAYRSSQTPTSHFRRRTGDGFLSPLANERSACMFTRIVELTTKPGKNKQLSGTINDKVLPILKKQKGFVDETVLISDKDDNRVLSLSFWNTKENAEQYHRAEYEKVQEMLRTLLEAEPVIRTFEVHTSTTHRIAAGKAA
jgi:heme-degrading monooxygenase HmoA